MPNKDIDIKFKIVLYSHFFKVLNPSLRITNVLLKFCTKYVHYGVSRTGGVDTENFKVFATKTKDNREFRFHIGQYEHFLHFIEGVFTKDEYVIEVAQTFNPPDSPFKTKEGWVLKDYQESARDFMVTSDQIFNPSKLTTMPMGSGKSLAVSSLIKTPCGWTRMGSLKVGHVITGWDGKPTVVTGVFPQGLRPIYELTFEDGRTARADLEHLWKVYTSSKDPGKVIETMEIIQRLDKEHLYIDLCKPPHDLFEDPLTWMYSYLKRCVSNPEEISDMSRYAKVKARNMELSNSIIDIVRYNGGIAKLKSDKVSIDITFPREDLKLRIISVKRIGKEQAQCISIDHPDKLFITDNYVVTHNTVTSMFSCSALGKRTAIIILPNYIEKWKSDVLGIIDVDPKRIMLVQGSKALKGLIHYGKEQDIKSDIVIFSLTTLRNFFTEYSERPAETIEEYGCTPEEMYQILGIGTVLIDEAHQHLHAIFRLMLHMHVPKLLALSATFIDDDRFIENMMKVMFPKELRFDDIKMEKYIQCYAYSYCFRDFRRSNIKTTEYGSKNYSHVAFERSLLKSKDKEVLPNYLKMIDSLIKTHWQEKYQQGDKAIVYAATIEMCTVIMNYLKTKYLGKLINKYTQGDPYSNIIESDICVSTIQSGGTAIDIPGLRFALMTTSISSSKSNLQTLGRLRKLKDRDVNFAYIYCEEIPKHLTYHLDKKVLFKDWVAYIKELRMSIRI